MEFAIAGAKIVDDYRILDNHAVVVRDGRIREILPVAALDPRISRRDVEGLLAPGFIDVQVNGGGGVLFNDARSVEGIRAIGAAHRKFGTTGFLPTLITDTREQMADAVEAAARRRSSPACPACSASILKGRSSIPNGRACTIPPGCARSRKTTSAS